MAEHELVGVIAPDPGNAGLTRRVPDFMVAQQCQRGIGQGLRISNVDYRTGDANCLVFFIQSFDQLAAGADIGRVGWLPGGVAFEDDEWLGFAD